MFQILPHPSDVGILARGSTREEALVEASRGLMSVIVDPDSVQSLEERTFQAPGQDEATQIVNWLNEILYFFDTEGLIFSDFIVDSWAAGQIVGHARGEVFEPGRHEFRTAVKAATYHQFQSGPAADGWQIKVFVDV
jgi:SHS2 domain-containing protein